MPEGEENISYQNPPKPEPHGEDFGVGEKKEFLKREEIRYRRRDAVYFFLINKPMDNKKGGSENIEKND